jgi:hypothetical protein
MKNLTNRFIHKLEMELENLYDAIEGSNPDTDFYETMCIKIAEKQEEIYDAERKAGIRK